MKIFSIGQKTWFKGNQVTIISEPYTKYGGMWQNGITADGKIITLATPEQQARNIRQRKQERQQQQAGFRRLSNRQQ